MDQNKLMGTYTSILQIYFSALKSLLFWIIYFYSGKVIFLSYQASKTADLTIFEIATAFVKGTRLDISVASYIIALYFVFSSLLFFAPKSLRIVYNWLHYIFIVIFSIIQVGNLELYRNWGFHIDTTPLLYIDTPKEMFASVPLMHAILLTIGAGLWSFLSIFLFNKYIAKRVETSFRWYWSPVLLISAGLMFIPIRGGTSIVALNSGAVYFSKNQFANHLAVNPVWNFQYSITKHSRLSKSHRYMADSTARRIFSNMQQTPSESTILLRKSAQPNIAIIVLESFTAKIIGALNGEKGVAPRFDSLAKEGILFNNIYSTADRSDKGLVAIFSGIPALPTLSMNKFPQKTQGFSSLVKPFTQKGYSNTFYYGGNINFANLKSYLMNTGFQNFVTMEDFDSKYYSSKWGVHDHTMFDRFYTDIQNEQTPFFKAFFTLSSHEPYDVPMKDKFSGSEENKFRNSIYYADSCIGNFFDKIKQTPIWDNTLFILVADHGSRHPNEDELVAPSKYHIPMLWIGGLLTTRDTVISSIMSQTDIASTLLNQLEMEHSNFEFSRNALDKNYNGFGFYTYNNGFGYISDSIQQIRDNTSGMYYTNTGVHSPEDSVIGLAYLQNIWLYFMDK